MKLAYISRYQAHIYKFEILEAKYSPPRRAAAASKSSNFLGFQFSIQPRSFNRFRSLSLSLSLTHTFWIYQIDCVWVRGAGV